MRQAQANSGPKISSLEELNDALRASPLLEGSGQVVAGEGPAPADIAFVGEQPGDEEDKQGRPFVGPAGRLLDKALSEAGIDRSRVYLTNAVKQFKFVQRFKRRIHDKPSMADVTHYRWWLKRELDFVEPSLVVSLGATAALALAGRRVTITKERGPSTFDGRRGFVTVHPSYLLRIPDDEARETAYAAFLADLHAVARLANLSTHGGR
jgi:uracil-DNA glycosylase family protein